MINDTIVQWTYKHTNTMKITRKYWRWIEYVTRSFKIQCKSSEISPAASGCGQSGPAIQSPRPPLLQWGSLAWGRGNHCYTCNMAYCSHGTGQHLATAQNGRYRREGVREERGEGREKRTVTSPSLYTHYIPLSCCYNLSILNILVWVCSQETLVVSGLPLASFPKVHHLHMQSKLLGPIVHELQHHIRAIQSHETCDHMHAEQHGN